MDWQSISLNYCSSFQSINHSFWLVIYFNYEKNVNDSININTAKTNVSPKIIDYDKIKKYANLVS